MSVLLLMVSMVAVDAPWFYPGVGSEVVEIAADSTVGGVPVRRTGHLVARVDDPQAIEELDDVAAVEVLAGDGHVVRIRPVVGVDDFALSRELRDRDDVVWAHPDLAMRLVPRELPDDPFVADQWHLENTGQQGWTPGVDINAETAWAIATGAGGMVAVLDSGVDSDHPDLDVVVGWDYVGRDEDSNPDMGTDEGPHGTAAAGLAAATGDNGLGVAGVAYDAQVYGIRLLGGDTTLTDFYDAFVEAVDAGAWVLSNSWGFGDDCPDIPIYSTFEEAFAYAEDHGRGGLGTAIVVAAGNGGCDNSNDGFQGLPEAISVAATDGNDEREWYSSFGSVVDVAAPSGGVLTTDVGGDEGYGSWNDDPDYHGGFSGTSASTPIVAGTLAVMFEANPRLTAAQAREVLSETSVRIDVEDGGYDAWGWSMYYGYGRIDAGAAVLAVADDGPPDTPAVIAPADEAWVERVLLQWEPVEDPDGSWVDYEVVWWVQTSNVQHVITSDLFLDLTGEVEEGDLVTWWVQGIDAWGGGNGSDVTAFEVVSYEVELPEPADDDDEPEDEGCTCSADGRAGTGAGMAAMVGMALAIRRRMR
jgi:subtilisin family serine protease